MYHVRVHSLAARLLGHICKEDLLRAGDRVGIAVSGGIDSVALLRLILELRDELGVVVSAVHFNHKLRGAESDADQDFVEKLVRGYGLEFFCESGDTEKFAAEEHSGIESAARNLRYEFFRKLLGEDESPQGLKPSPFVRLDGAAKAPPLYCEAQALAPLSGSTPPLILDKIATGHTLDDQAETVLLRMIRGTGMRGLGGIHPRLVVDPDESERQAEIIRPLLAIRRRELQRYLTDHNQPWRQDSTNADSKFTRNRLRKLIVPVLECEFNPAVAESLAELAEIARDEEDYWENEASGWLGTVVQWSQPECTRGIAGFEDAAANLVQIDLTDSKAPDAQLLQRIEQSSSAIMNASVSRPWLLTEPKAVQRRVLKAVGAQAGIPLEFKHIEEMLRFAAEEGPAGKMLSLPLGWTLLREREAIVFITPDLRREERVPGYEYRLSIPGRALIPELGVVIEALRRDQDAFSEEYNPQHLLNAELMPDHLMVRNWRAGDRFWPAHTKGPHKVKELLQRLKVEQTGRRLWPVVANGTEIVWLRGFPVPAKFAAKPGQDAVLIRESPLEADDEHAR